MCDLVCAFERGVLEDIGWALLGVRGRLCGRLRCLKAFKILVHFAIIRTYVLPFPTSNS
jgi:hypothetical protein